MRTNTLCIAILLLALAATTTIAETEPTPLMDADWAESTCAAWNADPVLTVDLDKWIKNDGDRGYKLLRVYRRDCEDSPQIELKIALREGKVECIAGGWASDEELTGADYVMSAKTESWQEMGAGGYGPMRGMLTGRLKFVGPKWEAMKNMGPFESFLLLVGKVPGETANCPAG